MEMRHVETKNLELLFPVFLLFSIIPLYLSGHLFKVTASFEFVFSLREIIFYSSGEMNKTVATAIAVNARFSCMGRPPAEKWNEII